MCLLIENQEWNKEILFKIIKLCFRFFPNPIPGSRIIFLGYFVFLNFSISLSKKSYISNKTCLYFGLICIVCGVPCIWWMIFHKFWFLIIEKDFESNLKHETSLMMSILCFKEKSITFDFLVSIDNKVLGNFFLNFFITCFTLWSSFFWDTIFEPGLDDSPPTSMIFAPDSMYF